ncbi:transmembrane protein 254 isoform X1 [Erythrolamprus reginae]|uniref:transmembrane protein 254 isoform X1 n=1 Tax=Erythrolamprus reginae TaxID=121349 RepID=UPI00396D043A
MASRSDSAARSQHPATYFRGTRPFIAALAVGGMIYCGFAVLAPSRIPYDGLGPLGKLTIYLQENHKTVFHWGSAVQISPCSRLTQPSILPRYAVSCFLHVGEAFLSLWLCNKKGIMDKTTQLKWFVQTLFCGFFSLYHLLAYKPPKKTH